MADAKLDVGGAEIVRSEEDVADRAGLGLLHQVRCEILVDAWRRLAVGHG